MSSNLVIVAIPADDDRVWKVSSETKPHMTLLFLGEADKAQNLDQLMLFVQHATELSERGPFYLDVDHRGTLGPDDADVLFFNKRSWNLGWVRRFRGQLLQNETIKTAYDSVEQYEEWTPHLTLGYPTAPAKPLPDTEDHPFYSVSFDRIAVWTGDFQGPDFRLEYPDRALEDDHGSVYGYESAMAMSTTNDIRKAMGLDSIVEHHGIKGMRWGQRKTETVTVGGKTKNVTPKKAAKLDAQWEKNQYTIPKAVERHNAMADHFNQRIGALNDKYKDHDFSKEWEKDPADWSPTHKQYMKEVDKLENDGFHKAVEQELPSPTGKKKTAIGVKNGMMSVVIKDVAAKHTAVEDGDEVFLFKVTFNAKGLITKTEPVEDSMAQSDAFVAEYLEHFGTKGMKWGVRKEQLKSGARKVGSALGTIASAMGEHFYEQSVYSSFKHEAIHNQVADEIDAKMYKLQTAPKYRGKNLKTDHDLKKQYDQDVAKVTEVAYRKAVKDQIGENASGTKEARFVDDARGARIEIRDKRTGEVRRESSLRSIQEIQADRLDESLAQAATKPEAAPDITIPVKLDDNGQIKAVGRVQSKAEHTTDLGADFLEHYGVKGMRWGQRKEQFKTNVHNRRVAAEAATREKRPAQDVRAYPTIGTSKRKPGHVDTKGGEDHPPTEDAVKVHSARQKLKKSGTDALTNQELKEVATRLNLEQQVRQLEAKSPRRKSLGRQFIDKFMGDKDLQKKAGGFALKTAAKRSAKVGAAAALL